MKRKLFISFFIPVFIIVVVFMFGIGLISFSSFSDLMNIEIMSLYILMAVVSSSVISILLSYLFYKRNIKPMEILENYIRKTYMHKTIAEVSIQSLPPELKNIADIFKVTTKSLKEHALKEEEQKLYLYSTLDTMEDGLLAIDEQNNIKLINKSAMSIFNLSDKNIVGSNILVQTQNVVLSDAVNSIEEGSSVSEIIIDDKLYKITVYKLEQQKGKLILLNDITKLKQLENMRKEFVSNVSHELKTPLTAIRGFVETLKDGAIDDPGTAAKFLGIIDIESQRLEKLISDLLELSHIESNKIDRYNVKIDIKEVAQTAIDAYKNMASKKNVTITNHILESQLITGNLDLFKAMLYNLVSNAIKYNVDGGKIDIRLKDDEYGIIIEVTDTGIGISKENQVRIFERFYKVDKSRSFDPDSTGLGLSIVKHILELFDGDISVKSTLGEGTTFRIYLPKKEVK